MTSSLRTRLTLSYMLVASLCVLLVSVLVNGVLESSFRRYLRDEQAKEAQAVVARIGSQIGADGEWDQAELIAVGTAALEQGMIVKLSTPDGVMVWVALAALAMAGGLGIVMARRITLPLERVARATQMIASGHRGVVIAERTRVRELDGIASAVNDLSRALRDQEALRHRLTTDMAHELRTPLATLQSHLEALIDGVWEPAPARLAALHREILRINRLVADLENLARYDSESLVLSKTNIDLIALSLDIVANHEPQYRVSGIDLTFSSDIAEATVSADSDKLSQAVINLLSNALKFTPSGGTVRVGVAISDSEALLSVADTGVGIASADLPFIFERFYRADSSRSRQTGGSGIGLAITKTIVEAHGGGMSVSSTPERGSTFTISLPRAL